MNTTFKTLVMNFVQSHGEARRKDIVRFIHELKGMPYNTYHCRGYWSTSFVTPQCRVFYKTREQNKIIPTNYTKCGYFMRPSKSEPRFLIQDKPYGPYRVTTI